MPKLDRLKELKSNINELRRPGFNNETGLLMSSSSTNAMNTNSNSLQGTVADKLEEELRQLTRELTDINAKSDQVIRPQDAAIAMKSLGKRMSKRENYDMVWEIDEKTEGVVDWEEYQLMFERNIREWVSSNKDQLRKLGQVSTSHIEFSFDFRMQ